MRKKKLFVPFTVDNPGRRIYDEWTWVKAIVLIALMLVFAGLWFNLYYTSMYIDFKGTIPFLIITESVNAYVWLALIRYFVIKERFLKKIYSQTKEHRVTDLSVVWGIYNVSGNMLMFIDGRCGVLVSASHGFIFGRPDGFEEMHFDKLSSFMRHILIEGYDVKYYNRMITDANLEPLKETERIVSQTPDTGIYYLEAKTIKYLRELAVKVADTERDYWLVTCNGVDRMQDMLTRVKQAMELLEGSMFTEIRLCDERDVYNFVQDYFGVFYIDVQTLFKNTFSQSKRYIQVSEWIYADEDLKARQLMIEKNEEYRKREQEILESAYITQYKKLQEANLDMVSREQQAKYNFILQRRGINLKRISRRKYTKLVRTITQEEMEIASRELERLRSSATKKKGITVSDDYML